MPTKKKPLKKTIKKTVSKDQKFEILRISIRDLKPIANQPGHSMAAPERYRQSRRSPGGETHRVG